MLEHIITNIEAGERLDKILVKLNANVSRQQVQAQIKGKHVFVNGVHKKANYICKQGDQLKWKIIEESKLPPIEAEKIAIDILYEDEFVIVINKPKGMLVHPTNVTRTGTLVNALKFHSNKLSNVSGDERPGIVHRLDQDTSGVLVVAKDNQTHEHLKNQFQMRTVKRVYEAVVTGVVVNDNGIIKAPIGRDPKNRLKMNVVQGGKEAETHYMVLERFQQATLVQCELKTGRTHQIRVHMKYIQHPIIGDNTYNKKRSQLIESQALFAKQLCFHHPQLNEWKCFTVDIPTDFANLLHSLRKTS